jgi:hypothetical protein
MRLLALNIEFVDRFRVARWPTGRIKFDYMQNAGELRIEVDGHVFVTKWSMAGSGSIHAYGAPGSIALAKTAREFAEIDDPGAFEFVGHSKHAHTGQVVIFKDSAGYALVKVEHVLAGPERGDPYTEATISYELRVRD